MRQTASLRSEQHHVTRLPVHLVVSPGSARLDGKPSRGRLKRLATGLEIGMHVYGGHPSVIETGTTHRTTIEIEAQRFDQMQLGAGIGAEPDYVSGVGWDLGLE